MPRACTIRNTATLALTLAKGAARRFLNEQAKRNSLGGNAMRVFNLKLPAGKLAHVA